MHITGELGDAKVISTQKPPPGYALSLFFSIVSQKGRKFLKVNPINPMYIPWEWKKLGVGNFDREFRN